MAQTLGIDFGTSNSAAGILVDNAPHLIEIEPGHNTLPTSVFFDFEERATLFGTPAIEALIEGREGRFMRSLKSVLGTSLMHETRQIMGERITFVDIIARFLSEVKTRAETAVGQSFDRALSGRPVHFHSGNPGKDAQAEQDLIQCYHAAGFVDVCFLHEPQAAAIASKTASKTDCDMLGLIVDIGGGTSDFSLFRRGDAGIEIIQNHGVRVGGTDFDKSLSLEVAMPHLGRNAVIVKEMGAGTLTAPNALFQDLATWEKIPFLYAPETRRMAAQLRRLAHKPQLFERLEAVLTMEFGHDIAFAVERGKISSNKADAAHVDLSIVEAGLAPEITPATLAACLGEHAAKIGNCALETLAMAGHAADDVDTVVFVGGSSLMRAVSMRIEALFPRAMHQYSDAFTAIIDGLAIASGRSR